MIKSFTYKHRPDTTVIYYEPNATFKTFAKSLVEEKDFKGLSSLAKHHAQELKEEINKIARSRKNDKEKLKLAKKTIVNRINRIFLNSFQENTEVPQIINKKILAKMNLDTFQNEKFLYDLIIRSTINASNLKNKIDPKASLIDTEEKINRYQTENNLDSEQLVKVYRGLITLYSDGNFRKVKNLPFGLSNSSCKSNTYAALKSELLRNLINTGTKKNKVKNYIGIEGLELLGTKFCLSPADTYIAASTAIKEIWTSLPERIKDRHHDPNTLITDKFKWSLIPAGNWNTVKEIRSFLKNNLKKPTVVNSKPNFTDQVKKINQIKSINGLAGMKLFGELYNFTPKNTHIVLSAVVKDLWEELPLKITRKYNNSKDYLNRELNWHQIPVASWTHIDQILDSVVDRIIDQATNTMRKKSITQKVKGLDGMIKISNSLNLKPSLTYQTLSVVAKDIWHWFPIEVKNEYETPIKFIQKYLGWYNVPIQSWDKANKVLNYIIKSQIGDLRGISNMVRISEVHKIPAAKMHGTISLLFRSMWKSLPKELKKGCKDSVQLLDKKLNWHQIPISNRKTINQLRKTLITKLRDENITQSEPLQVGNISSLEEITALCGLNGMRILGTYLNLSPIETYKLLSAIIKDIWNELPKEIINAYKTPQKFISKELRWRQISIPSWDTTIKLSNILQSKLADIDIIKSMPRKKDQIQSLKDIKALKTNRAVKIIGDLLKLSPRDTYTSLSAIIYDLYERLPIEITSRFKHSDDFIIRKLKWQHVHTSDWNEFVDRSFKRLPSHVK